MIFSGTTRQTPIGDRPDETGNWFPENLAQIKARLAKLASCAVQATQLPAVAVPVPLVAVFDFDNTCIFRDVGQAVFRFQAQHLRYRLSPEQLAAILPSTGTLLAGRPMAALTAVLLDTYRALYPLIAAGLHKDALRLPQHSLFAALLLWFVDQARKDEQFGPQYVLPFMGKLLAGFSTAELRLLAVEVVQAVGKEPLIEERLAVHAPAPIGYIESSYSLGLHAYPEMRALMHTLAGLGIERYVISASAEWLVQGAVEWLNFPVRAGHIFGIRLRLDERDVLTIDDPTDYPLTFRKGKAEIITQQITGRRVLVAGDADTDYEMLTLPEVDIRLLINRQQSGLISSLYQDPCILLQGLNLATGHFRPSRETRSD